MSREWRAPFWATDLSKPWDRKSHGFLLFIVREERHECEYETLELEEGRMGRFIGREPIPASVAKGR